ncbi:MAG: hypothetical protein ACJ731_14185 [Vicinamibacterales bacterium]
MRSAAVIITALMLQVLPAYAGADVPQEPLGGSENAAIACPLEAVAVRPNPDEQVQVPTPRPPSVQPPAEPSCIDHPRSRYKRALVRFLAEVARAAAGE